MARVYHQCHPEQRTGQAYFNALHEHRPEIAQALCATLDDPFYRTDKLGRFLARVEEMWN